MKQILQDLKTGELLLQEVAIPKIKPAHLLIQTRFSLISAGTERMLVDFGRAGYISKARQQPERVRQVLDKVRADGLLPTLEAVRAKLDQPLPLGYCNVGCVLEIGEGVHGFKIGDRVASNGSHAEVVAVPVNLCAKIPDEVSDEQAAFTVVSAIGLQGIRLLRPTVGESIAVFGLGLIGLIAVQILKASGTRVIGFDYDTARVELARSYRINAIDLSSGTDPVQAAVTFSQNRGIDGVLITAATQSHELMHQAAEMSRKRGRIVLTGTAGLNLRRSDFYEKELTFQVSCSYGPGRYDSYYEEKGQDYPLAYVRWTAQRNFEAVLELFKENLISVDKLISIRAPLARAKDCYEAILQENKEVISALIEYPDSKIDKVHGVSQLEIVIHGEQRDSVETVVVGVIGSGSFTRLKILPTLKKSSSRLKWIASAGGTSGGTAASKFGVERSTTDYRYILNDAEVNAVFIATRHDTHASIVVEALKAGKSVFVEKPLCINREELEEIIKTYREVSSGRVNGPILMVGYNRRFSPLVSLIRAKIANRQTPLAVAMICNAGRVASEHWVNDPSIGGGRIIAEACHFIDLLHFIVDAPIKSVAAMKQIANTKEDLEDTVSICLTFRDGSIGQINYFSSGSKRYPKERMDVFGEGRVLQLNNFRQIKAFGFGKFKGRRLWSQDKGHKAGFLSFVDAVKEGKQSPIGFESIVNTTLAAFAAVEAMREERVVFLDE